MKLEQLIVQYLYNSKKVTIQDIGSFTISPELVLPAENDKEAILPAGAIGFEFDGKAPQDDSLIEFIMQQTRKIRPLAASDLESYSILSKQFLNLGKPLVIEGLGTLLKNQAGIYEFTQGLLVNARLESAPTRATEKNSEEISFRSPEKKTGASAKKGGMVALLLLLVLVIGAAVFYFLHNKKQKVAEEPVTAVVQDTPVAATKPDTMVQAKPDSIIKPATDTVSLKPAPVAGPYTFTVAVIKAYKSKASADKSVAKFIKYGYRMTAIDSITYKMTIPVNRPISDTARAKDSLAIFFGSKTYIDQ